MKKIFSRWSFSFLALAWVAFAGAQTPPTEALDAKELKQYQKLLNHKFTRDHNDLFSALEHANKAEQAAAADLRFISYFRLSEWGKVRSEFAKLPPELARGIYDKILNDLADRQKSNLRLEDVLALADAVPGELTDDELRKVGEILGLIVPANETYWLADRLRAGTEKLGGTDPAKRLLTGRVLLAGGFRELARTYWPAQSKLEEIKDEGLRNEVAAFLAAEQANESVQREQVQKVWDEGLRVLSQTKVNDWEKTKAGNAMARVMMQVAPGTIAPAFAALLKDNPDSAIRLVSGIERKIQNDAHGEVAQRTENLRAQLTLANLIAAQTDLKTSPWSQLVQLMAEYWMSEAENTFTMKGSNVRARSRSVRAIDAEDLLDAVPTGKWLDSLPPDLRDRFDASLSKAILASANFEIAADRIIDLSKRHPQTGVALAEDFLASWAQAHNPQLPEEMRKKFGLPEDARIPITPIMMERNIDSLARMMALFREAKIAPRDYAKVVNAFDVTYSNAEAYRDTHIEKVFGPIPQLDEEVFFLLVNRMHSNLADRWRKMDIQRASLTRRTEFETYEMVREGYATNLRMIDSWMVGKTEASRALTLAGVLLTEWGDFESMQELVATDPQKRVVTYKEKNLLAQDYFQRAAEAYGREILKLSPSEYTIEVYITWFQCLLGLGPSGQVNLNKTINRAGLAKIRASILALPGKAASAHMNLLAKNLNARLTDENYPLHEDLKYRYLASTLVVTKDDPFTMGLKKKAAYFDELLSEIRLQTRIDGPNTIGIGQEFGIVISVVHTEAMGRVARFGQYLSNDPAAITAKGKRRATINKKVRETQGPRDEFEQSLTETLTPYFDVKTIIFSTPEVKARPTARIGWEETVLAYALVRAKDASVDKVPPIQLELKFIDLSGPVTIPATSAETLIKMVATPMPARPASKVEITETFDTRQFPINGGLTLEIKATANGLVPELDDLLDLAAFKQGVEIRQISPHEGLQLKELNTWGETVAPRSERLWTLTLNGDPIRAADRPADLSLPAAKSKDFLVQPQTYKDLDLVPLPGLSVRVDRVAAVSGAALSVPGHRPMWWLSVGGAVVVGLVGLLFLLLRSRRTAEIPIPRARDVFKMPAQVDAFAVVALLRRLGASPLVRLNASQQSELTSDVERLQQACFGGSGQPLSEAELRRVVDKWLRAIR